MGGRRRAHGDAADRGGGPQDNRHPAARDVDLGLFDDDDRVVYARETIDGQTVVRPRKVGPGD